ncbi:MAG: protein kinase, partial [Deltaproteobacteria bacterium]|nr:protein kinase [Deltaproteobacteria bacterium]
ASRKSFRQRFINEARAARTLGSPHVVKVFDHAFDDRGIPYIVMEYLRGEPLQAVIKQQRLTPHRTLRIALQITGALQECHDAKILHRDLKPGNILLIQAGREDFIKIIDFGIAHLPIPEATETGTLLGTPKYMPPEQIRQHELDEGTDIFALGVILFECLCGEPPIKASTAIEYMSLNLQQPPRKLRELAPELPETLEAVLDHMMAKERGDRPASMRDVEARLLAVGRAQGWLPYSMRMPAISRTAIQGGQTRDYELPALPKPAPEQDLAELVEDDLPATQPDQKLPGPRSDLSTQPPLAYASTEASDPTKPPSPLVAALQQARANANSEPELALVSAFDDTEASDPSSLPSPVAALQQANARSPGPPGRDTGPPLATVSSFEVTGRRQTRIEEDPGETSEYIKPIADRSSSRFRLVASLIAGATVAVGVVLAIFLFGSDQSTTSGPLPADGGVVKLDGAASRSETGSVDATAPAETSADTSARQVVDLSSARERKIISRRSGKKQKPPRRWRRRHRKPKPKKPKPKKQPDDFKPIPGGL